MSEYQKPFTDLNQYVPEVYKNPVLDSLMSNLFNRFLTKEDFQNIQATIGKSDIVSKIKVNKLEGSNLVDFKFTSNTAAGGVNDIIEVVYLGSRNFSVTVNGSKNFVLYAQELFRISPFYKLEISVINRKVFDKLTIGEKFKFNVFTEDAKDQFYPDITEVNEERSVNQLIAVTKTPSGYYGFNDVLNRLNSCLIDTNYYQKWGRQTSYNFNLPIDYDKFVNFSSYQWVGDIKFTRHIQIINSLASNSVSFDFASRSSNTEYSFKEITGTSFVRCDSFINDEDKHAQNVTIDVLSAPVSSLLLKINGIINNDGTLSVDVSGVIHTINSGDTLTLPEFVAKFDIASGTQPGTKIRFKIVPILRDIPRTSITFIPLNSAVPSSVLISSEYIGSNILIEYADFLFNYPSNPDRKPHYNVIQKNAEFSNIWTDQNCWIHVQDIQAFNEDAYNAIANPLNSSLSTRTKNALRPIIEVNSSLGEPVNDYQIFNDTPQYDLFFYTGQKCKVGSVLKYTPGDYVDSELGLSITKTDDKFKMSSDLICDQLLCYKFNGDLRTIWFSSNTFIPSGQLDSVPISSETMDDYELNEASNSASLSDKRIVWNTPENYFKNMKNDVQTDFFFGDLFTHFSSIINSNDSQNFRKLETPDLSLGGTIKHFDKNFQLFCSMFMLDGLTPFGIIDFARNQYQVLLDEIQSYTRTHLAEIMVKTRFRDTSTDLRNESASSIDQNISLFYDEVKAYLSSRGLNAFQDSSSIESFILTLPYLGFAPNMKPGFVNHPVLGAPTTSTVFRHHDGHYSNFIELSNEEIIEIINEQFSLGDTTYNRDVRKNHVGPQSPDFIFSGQLWLNTTLNKVFVFDAGLDSNVAPNNAVDGDIWFNSITQQVFEYRDMSWAPSGITRDSLWKEVNLSHYLNRIKLVFEQKLFENCHFDQNSIRDMSDIDRGVLRQTFIQYCKNIDIEPFNNITFNATNAFTWNYASSTIPYVDTPGSYAQIYTQYCGTPRPDLEPWKFWTNDKPSNWDDLFLDTTGYRLWKLSTWTYVKTQIALTDRPDRKLCVNPTTGQLLPPYVNPSNLASSEALLTSIPLNMDAAFEFGDLHMQQIAYESSLSYRYDLLKNKLRMYPLKTMDELFNFNYTSSGHPYNILYGKNVSPSELLIHGDVRRSDLSILKISANIDVELKVVNIQNDLTTLIINGTKFQLKLTDDNIINIAGTDISVKTDIPYEFNIGDQVVIIGGVRTNYPYEIYRHHSILQWLVNFNRFTNSNQSSIALLKSDEVKLAYRFGGFVEDDVFSFSVNDNILNKDDFDIIVKKSVGTKSIWFDTLRVQLVQIGQFERNGVGFIPSGRAEDWEFRIENLNPLNPYLKFDTFDSSDTFEVDIPNHRVWEKPAVSTGSQIVTFPHTVKGLQNLINILFGYASSLDRAGVLFMNGKDVAIDETTSRVINYQFLIERFMKNLYSGKYLAGSGEIFNPYPNKLWIKSDIGSISAMNEIIIDPIASQTLFDPFGEIIPSQQIAIYRNNDINEIKSDIFIGSAHVFINEYEHMIVFNDLSIDGTILMNPFIGIHQGRIVGKFNKNRIYTGRISTPGFYLTSDGRLRKNIENSIDSISRFYDSSRMVIDDAQTNQARKLLGYQNPSFAKTGKFSDKAKFEFWKGLVFNKGTETSVDAFFNSYSREAMSFNEFWAFKVAEYGSSEVNANLSFRAELSDVQSDITRYSFSPNVVNTIDVSTRWNQLNPSFSYQKDIEDIQIVNITDKKTVWFEKPFDDIEVVKLSEYIDSTADYLQMNRDARDDIFETNAIFEIINRHCIVVEGSGTYKVVAKRYDLYRFDPIYVGTDLTIAPKQVQIWHPAINKHMVEHLPSLDIISSNDPANYSVTLDSINNKQNSEPWLKDKVGTTWFDNANLKYVHYYDDIIMPNADLRASIWGDIANFSSIKINRWIESSVPPSRHKSNGLDGYPAQMQTFYSIKDINVRPIAWAYSSDRTKNLPMFPRSFGSSTVMIQNGVAILSANVWNVEPDVTRISGGIFDINKQADNVDSLLVKPFGEAVVRSGEYKVFGSYNDFSNVEFAQDSEIALVGFEGDHGVGEYSFARINQNLIKLTNLISGKVLEGPVYLTIPDENQPSINRATVEFDEFTITFEVNYDPFGSYASTDEIVDEIIDRLVNSEIVCRSAVNVDVIIDFYYNDLTRMTYDESNIVLPAMDDQINSLDTETVFESFIIYDVPTDLSDDVIGNYQKWVPVIGDFIPVTLKTQTIGSETIQFISESQKADIKQNDKTPFIYTDGTEIQKYEYSWRQWNELKDQRFSYKIESDDLIELDFSNEFMFTNKVEVYSNGFSSNHFILDNTKVSIQPSVNKSLHNDIAIGDMVDVIYTAFKPSEDQVNAGRDVPVFEQIAYSQDANHSVWEIKDQSGNTLETRYYYWVTETTRDDIPTNTIRDSLMNYDKDVYAVIENDTTLVFNNLRRIISSDSNIQIKNTAKIQYSSFNQRLKDIHAEWVLHHPKQTIDVHPMLWKAVARTLDPSYQIDPSIIEFDTKHGTNMKFDIKEGTIMCPRDVAVAAVNDVILSAGKQSMYTHDDIDSIYANDRQLANDIFFELLNILVSINKDIDSVFKSSYIAFNAQFNI